MLQNSKSFPGNFGAIRLLMAILVIISHTPVLIDGNTKRELLTNWFGVLSFGEAAVDGFFLVSGYMLALSVIKSGSLSNYFIKRVARIYPAFVTSFLICIILVSLFVGVNWNIKEILLNLVRLVLLQPPRPEDAFVGAPFPALNGAMWTISYEFFCYIFLAGIFSLGLLRRRGLLIGIVIILNVFLITRPHLDLLKREITFGGGSQNLLRFVAAFCTGVCYRQILRPERLHGWIAVLGSIILPITLSNFFLAEPSLILIGGYILIYLGESRISKFISRVGQETDLSYGIYLYAWPIQNITIWEFGLKSIIQVDIITIAISSALAFFSWTIIERPAMRTAINLTRRRGASNRNANTELAVEDAGAP